jgi:hypothetical protein
VAYYAPRPEMLTELGIERLCGGCGEWWPKDDTFWFFDRRGKVLGRCRACWSERRRGERLDNGRRRRTFETDIAC